MLYIIPGIPIPWMRAIPLYKNRTMYNSQKNQMLITQSILKQQHGTRDMFDGPLQTDFTFYMPIPPSKKKVNVADWHDVKPDADNLCAYYLDCAQGIIFINDSRISKLTARKLYSNSPRTEITVMELA